MTEKKNYIHGVIGCGMGGSRIAKCFSEEGWAGSVYNAPSALKK